MQEASDFRVGVIGLGSMGMGAAKACIAAGIETYGVDLRPAICAELLEAGAKETGSNARSFAGRLDAVVVLVVNAQQCEDALFGDDGVAPRSEEHTSELQSLMRISYAVFCLKKKKDEKKTT